MQVLHKNLGTSITSSLKLPKDRSRWLYYFIMIWVGRNALFIRQRQDYSAVDMLAMVQIAAVFLILAFLFFSPTAKFRRLIKTASIKYYFFYLLLGMGSALWSVYPAYSLFRALEAFTLSAGILYFCTSVKTVEECVNRIQLLIWPTLLANWVGLILLVGFKWQYRSNGFGASAAMVATFFAAWILTSKGRQNLKKMLQAVCGLTLLLSSFSLASWWSFWFGLSYCAAFTRRKGMVVLLLIIGASLFLAADQFTRQNLLLLDKQPESLENMTGRKTLWTDYMAASRERPVFGYGYAMGGRTVGEIYATNTHNMFFGALVGVGWVGVCIGALFFLFLVLELIRFRHFKYPIWLACMAALSAGFLNNMSVSIISEQFMLPTVIFVSLLSFHLVCLRNTKAKKHSKIDLMTDSAIPRRRIVIKW